MPRPVVPIWRVARPRGRRRWPDARQDQGNRSETSKVSGVISAPQAQQFDLGQQMRRVKNHAIADDRPFMGRTMPDETATIYIQRRR